MISYQLYQSSTCRLAMLKSEKINTHPASKLDATNASFVFVYRGDIVSYQNYVLGRMPED